MVDLSREGSILTDIKEPTPIKCYIDTISVVFLSCKRHKYEHACRCIYVAHSCETLIVFFSMFRPQVLVAKGKHGAYQIWYDILHNFFSCSTAAWRSRKTGISSLYSGKVRRTVHDTTLRKTAKLQELAYLPC